MIYVRYLFLEYCNGERFRASCAQDEVIIMRSALLGRMHIGKCLERDLGHLGCSADVLKHFDSECSNKRECEVAVSEIPVQRTGTACPKDLMPFLEASFHCAQGISFCIFFYLFTY